MKDQAKTKRQLIAELEAMRRTIAELEAELARNRQAEDRRTVVGIDKDVTEHERTRDQLQASHDRLEERLRRRGTQLRETNQQLQVEVEQRRSAEEHLAIFQRFVEAAAQGFGMADARGYIMYANPCLARLFARQHPDEVIGKHLSNFYPDDYLHRREREILPALLRGEPWQGEQMLRFPDGQMHPTIHTVFPVMDEDGSFFRTAVVITDITELRQAEAALRQSYEDLRKSDERYDLVVRGAGVGICDWSAHTGKVYFSPRFQVMFGYDEEEFGDTVDDWVNRVHPEDLPSVLQQQDAFLTSSESTATLEYRFRHKDGTYRWVTSHMIVVRDDNGDVVRMVGSHGDVTDRKLAELRLKREQRALHRMVVASDHERKLIIYDLHDGVAQQLMGALLLVRSLRCRKNSDVQWNEKTHRQAVDALSRASTELRRVMNWLRTPVLEKFGLVEAIEDVAIQLRALPAAPNIRYRHDVQFQRLEPTLENSLFRIAQEAMNNACRHSRSDQVEVELVQHADQVTLTVQDWGIGFDEQSVEGPHFGLEGIRERTRILGGQLTIRSSKEQGTTIRVTLPLVKASDDQ